MSGRFACKVCGQFHEPHCMSSPINPPLAHGFITLPIDWKRERISMARAAMQGIVHDFPVKQTGGPEIVAMIALQVADALIAELKKEVQP